jgi:Purple acid Phosphatase, N-terminal domain
MKRFLLPLIVAAVGGSLCCTAAAAQSSDSHAQDLPPAKRATHVQIVNGPALEVARADWAIIRWTSNNPGGTDEHFAVAHYGTDPKQLSQVAKSHIRLNRNHPDTVFRVMLMSLKPKTTYYYTVDSMGADGTDDGVKSPELHFATP